MRTDFRNVIDRVMSAIAPPVAANILFIRAAGKNPIKFSWHRDHLIWGFYGGLIHVPSPHSESDIDVLWRHSFCRDPK